MCEVVLVPVIFFPGFFLIKCVLRNKIKYRAHACFLRVLYFTLLSIYFTVCNCTKARVQTENISQFFSATSLSL